MSTGSDMNDTRGKPPASRLSIVVPAYDEEGNVERLYTELIKVLPLVNMPWEIVFIDDGSTDSTWAVIEALHERDSRVKGIRLSRNFGHQQALFAGLQHAAGDVVISMDADLQHPPGVVPSLIAEWRSGSQIVHTIRKDATDHGLFKGFISRLFYKMFSFLSGIDLKYGMADFRLMDRKVLDDILQFQEAGLFLRGIVQWVGYPGSSITFQSLPRFSGSTKYTLRRMMKFAWHGFSSFSLAPLRLGILFGLTASVLSFFGVAYAMYSKFIAGDVIPGWTSTVAIVSFLFGLLFVLLGLLGEYLGRIFVEVRRRPRFLLREQIGFDEPAGQKEASSNRPT